jgi:hypothetical protein
MDPEPEQGFIMRKIIRPWTVAVISIAATLVVLIGYGNRHPNSPIGQGTQIASHIGSHYILRRADAAEEAALEDGYSADDETLAAPEEPEPVAAEPEAAANAAPVPASVAGVSVPAIKAMPALEANAHIPERSVLATAPPLSEIVPAVMPASAEEFLPERYRVMPACEEDKEESRLLMPYACDENQEIRTSTSLKPTVKKPVDTGVDTGHVGGSEEQEMIAPTAAGGWGRIHSIIEKHARDIFSPGVGEGGRGRPSTDTLEFRPSDAREGEFEPIEF